MAQRARLLFSLILLVPAFLQLGCGSGSQAVSESAPKTAVQLGVRATAAGTAEWPVTVPFSGSLLSKSVVDVKPEVGGRLVAMHFSEGDLVRKGQLLAEIDDSNFRLAHDQAVAVLGVAQAGLNRAKVNLEHARREKERADNLLRTGGITEKDHQAATTGVRDAEAQVKLAEAQCEQARAAISIAAKALNDCRILAPAEGQVQRRVYDQGTIISPGQPLYTLVDNARLELECLLPSYRLAEIRSGLKATFTTPTFGTREFDGTVAAINPMVEPDNRSVKVLLRVSNPRGELRSGMFCRGIIEVRRQPDALVIPRSALITEQEDPTSGSVYVVNEGVARRRNVRIGGVREDRIWIQQGLERGELFIVEIGPSLKDGTPVKVLKNSSMVGQ
jgi:membrane fusion protein (multidrug efflux system)